MQIIDDTILNHFFALLKKRHIETHAVSIYQNGQILLEEAFSPFTVSSLHPIYSVTKSFTSMAIGFLVEEQGLDLNANWIDYVPQYRSYIADSTFEHVTIRHLLTMSLGQDSEIEVIKGDDWIKTLLGKNFSYEPGKVFLYNSYCSHMLSILVSELCGVSLAQYLNTRLFEPLGITRYEWEEDQFDRSLGGYGLHLSIHDLLKFGICCLHHGVWENLQVIPSGWLKQATSYQISNDQEYPKERSENRQGYGYHFWMCTHNAYRCSGLHGQLCLIQPENELVIAMFNATTGSQAVLNCLFEAMEDRQSMSPPVFELPLLKGWESNDVIQPYLNKVLVASPNEFGMESLRIEKCDDLYQITINRNGNEYEIKAAYGMWLKQDDHFREFQSFMTQDGIAPLKLDHDIFAFANYAWTTKTTLLVEIREWNRSCGTTFKFILENNRIVVWYHVNGLYTMITEAKCIVLLLHN